MPLLPRTMSGRLIQNPVVYYAPSLMSGVCACVAAACAHVCDRAPMRRGERAQRAQRASGERRERRPPVPDSSNPNGSPQAGPSLHRAYARAATPSDRGRSRAFRRGATARRSRAASGGRCACVQLAVAERLPVRAWSAGCEGPAIAQAHRTEASAAGWVGRAMRRAARRWDGCIALGSDARASERGEQSTLACGHPCCCCCCCSVCVRVRARACTCVRAVWCGGVVCE